MADDAGQMALVIAAVNDPAMKERLARGQAQLAEIEAAQEQLRDATERNQQVLSEIQNERLAIEAGKADVDQAKRDLDEKTVALTAVIKTHDEERARWETMRLQVDAAHAAAGAKHTQTEERHAALAIAHRDKGDELVRRERAVELAEAALARKHAALKTALAGSQAQPDVKTQVQDMVAQAEKLCAAGNEEEAADVISDASSMLAQ